MYVHKKIIISIPNHNKPHFQWSDKDNTKWRCQTISSTRQESGKNDTH